jgi:hypothetical protein
MARYQSCACVLRLQDIFDASTTPFVPADRATGRVSLRAIQKYCDLHKDTGKKRRKFFQSSRGFAYLSRGRKRLDPVDVLFLTIFISASEFRTGYNSKIHNSIKKGIKTRKEYLNIQTRSLAIKINRRIV